MFRKKKLKNLTEDNAPEIKAPRRHDGRQAPTVSAPPPSQPIDPLPPPPRIQRLSNNITTVRNSLENIKPSHEGLLRIPLKNIPLKKEPETVDLKMSDKDGLERAYNTKEGLFVFGDRMYIAGSKSLNDWKDDIMRIPVWGDSRKIQRYQDARKALLDHPEVIHISGHSLGSSVALQLQKDFRHIKDTRVYGSPVLDITPHIGAPQEKVERYRSFGDPVSMFDFNATSTLPTSLNPHAYGNLSEGFDTKKTVPIETTNPDGSKSFIA